jgi:DNA-binding NarL/FixJ family response regulator
MRILIADDHEVVLHGLRDLLRTHADWEVCGEARSGVEAVGLARQLGPNFAILDFSMPLLNGVEATRQIRAALPEIDVLLFSVHDSEQLVAEALEAGARGWVSKSSAATELIAAIESAARSPAPRANGLAAERNGRGAAASGTLTSRQRQIVQLVAEGKSNEQTARSLGISARTVETHRAHIMQRLGLRSVVQLVRYAVRNRIVDA